MVKFYSRCAVDPVQGGRSYNSGYSAVFQYDEDDGDDDDGGWGAGVGVGYPFSCSIQTPYRICLYLCRNAWVKKTVVEKSKRNADRNSYAKCSHIIPSP